MAKRKSTNDKYTSKGTGRCVASATSNAMRIDYLASSARLLNQLRAHRLGKRTMVTIENPNKAETNKRFIKVLGSTIFKNEKSAKAT